MDIFHQWNSNLFANSSTRRLVGKHTILHKEEDGIKLKKKMKIWTKCVARGSSHFNRRKWIFHLALPCPTSSLDTKPSYSMCCLFVCPFICLSVCLYYTCKTILNEIANFFSTDNCFLSRWHEKQSQNERKIFAWKIFSAN